MTLSHSLHLVGSRLLGKCFIIKKNSQSYEIYIKILCKAHANFGKCLVVRLARHTQKLKDIIELFLNVFIYFNKTRN